MPGGAVEVGADEPAPQPRLTVAAVARRLGVAPATLRTWDRRYRLGPSEHRAGAHRRYSAEDLRRLLVMQRLTQEGVAPAEAATLAREGPADGSAELPPSPRRPAGRSGGGRVVAVPDGSPAARGLARAAMALDSPECVRLVGHHLDTQGVVPTWEELLSPVLVAIGERWRTTGAAVEVEHMLCEAVLTALRTRATQVPGSRTVLLAAAEEEEHGLPLHVLAAACAERGVPTRMLGVRVPRAALAAAVRRTGPVAVFVYAQLPVSDPGQLDELPRLRPHPRLLLGGPGWPEAGPADAGERLGSLSAAVDRVVEVVGT